MKKLELTLKFGETDTIYTTKLSKVEKTCHVCDGLGRIKFNEKDMKCPECMGVGKFQSKKQIHIVCEEPFVITKTKVDINNDGKVNIKYKGICGYSRLNRSQENLFSTIEEAQQRCDELNKERTFLRTEDIQIVDEFKNNTPSLEKIQSKIEYYKLNKKFDKDIVVDKNNTLKDGYINYLLSQMLNINPVKVTIQD